jgi:ABC-type nitrate/sulfonate/bicarbonate transport system substrate-binding protein
VRSGSSRGPERKRWLAGLGRRLAVALCLLAFPAAARAEPIPLRYGQSFSTLRSIFSLPISIAEREGFFRREGLDFRVVVPIPGGSDKMIEALHQDVVDVTHVATPFLIRSALAGSDAVAIAAEFNNPVYSLVATPHIARFADLAGKLIGFADQGGTISASVRKLLALHGLREGDYRVKVIEGTPARFACLRRGECDAVPLGQPQDFSAVAEGYRLLGRSTEATPDFLYTVTAVRRSWASQNEDTLLRYVRALKSAFGFLREPANRNAVIKTVTDTTGASEAAAGQTLALYFEPERNVLPKAGEIALPALSQVVAMMAETGAIAPPLPDAARFVDLQYLRRAGIR